jgi:hypothetical protein
MAAIDSISEAFSTYKKNVAAYIIASVVYLISLAVSVGLSVSLFVLAIIFVGAFGISFANGSPNALQGAGLPFLAGFFLALVAIGAVFMFTASASTMAYINACNSIIQGRIPTILGIVEYGFRNGGTAFFIKFIQAAISAIVLAPFVFIATRFGSLPIFAAVLALGLGIAALISFFLSPAVFIAVLDKAGAIPALVVSIRRVARNFLDYLVIGVAVGLIAIVCAAIPILDIVLLPFFAAPLAISALCIFWKKAR